ncbi:hypothetical protein EDC01DRAFT_491514 [Geopyxis carbonaria]|nr:hypothetical protein EDC01DRAFT_491514 [Geopyxis carbonaria]
MSLSSLPPGWTPDRPSPLPPSSYTSSFRRPDPPHAPVTPSPLSPFSSSPPPAASAFSNPRTPIQTTYSSSHYYRAPRSTLTSPARSNYSSPSGSPTRSARRTRIQNLLASDPLLSLLTPATIRQLSNDSQYGFTPGERDWSLRAAEGIVKVGKWLREIEQWNIRWGRGRDGAGYLPPEPGQIKRRKVGGQEDRGMITINEEEENGVLNGPIRRKLFANGEAPIPETPPHQSPLNGGRTPLSRPSGKPMTPYQMKMLRKSASEITEPPTPSTPGRTPRATGGWTPISLEAKYEDTDEEEEQEEEEEDDDEGEIEYYGSLKRSTVENYERRIESIKTEIEELDVDGLKDKVLSYRTGIENSLTSSSAIITATTLQLLPPLHRLMKLLTIWAVRLAVLRIVPVFIRWLENATNALEAGKEALTSSAILAGTAKLDEDIYALISETIQQNVATAGRIMDTMLDALEGREDVLPDKWIAALEELEEDYGSWEMDAERVVLEGRLSITTGVEEMRAEREKTRLVLQNERVAEEAREDENAVGEVLEKVGEVEKELLETVEKHEQLEENIHIGGEEDDVAGSTEQPVGLGLDMGLTKRLGEVQGSDLEIERGRRWKRADSIDSIKGAFSPLASPSLDMERRRSDAEHYFETEQRSLFEAAVLEKSTHEHAPIQIVPLSPVAESSSSLSIHISSPPLSPTQSRPSTEQDEASSNSSPGDSIAVEKVNLPTQEDELVEIHELHSAAETNDITPQGQDTKDENKTSNEIVELDSEEANAGKHDSTLSPEPVPMDNGSEKPSEFEERSSVEVPSAGFEAATAVEVIQAEADESDDDASMTPRSASVALPRSSTPTTLENTTESTTSDCQSPTQERLSDDEIVVSPKTIVSQTPSSENTLTADDIVSPTAHGDYEPATRGTSLDSVDSEQLSSLPPTHAFVLKSEDNKSYDNIAPSAVDERLVTPSLEPSPSFLDEIVSHPDTELLNGDRDISSRTESLEELDGQISKIVEQTPEATESREMLESAEVLTDVKLPDTIPAPIAVDDTPTAVDDTPSVMDDTPAAVDDTPPAVPTAVDDTATTLDDTPEDEAEPVTIRPSMDIEPIETSQTVFSEEIKKETMIEASIATTERDEVVSQTDGANSDDGPSLFEVVDQPMSESLSSAIQGNSPDFEDEIAPLANLKEAKDTPEQSVAENETVVEQLPTGSPKPPPTGLPEFDIADEVLMDSAAADDLMSNGTVVPVNEGITNAAVITLPLEVDQLSPETDKAVDQPMFSPEEDKPCEVQSDNKDDSAVESVLLTPSPSAGSQVGISDIKRGIEEESLDSLDPILPEKEVKDINSLNSAKKEEPGLPCIDSHSVTQTVSQTPTVVAVTSENSIDQQVRKILDEQFMVQSSSPPLQSISSEASGQAVSSIPSLDSAPETTKSSVPSDDKLTSATNLTSSHITEIQSSQVVPVTTLGVPSITTHPPSPSIGSEDITEGEEVLPTKIPEDEQKEAPVTPYSPENFLDQFMTEFPRSSVSKMPETPHRDDSYFGESEMEDDSMLDDSFDLDTRPVASSTPGHASRMRSISMSTELPSISEISTPRSDQDYSFSLTEGSFASPVSAGQSPMLPPGLLDSIDRQREVSGASSATLLGDESTDGSVRYKSKPTPKTRRAPVHKMFSSPIAPGSEVGTDSQIDFSEMSSLNSHVLSPTVGDTSWDVTQSSGILEDESPSPAVDNDYEERKRSEREDTPDFEPRPGQPGYKITVAKRNLRKPFISAVTPDKSQRKFLDKPWQEGSSLKLKEAPVLSTAKPDPDIDLDQRVQDILLSLPTPVKLTSSNLAKLNDQSGKKNAPVYKPWENSMTSIPMSSIPAPRSVVSDTRSAGSQPSFARSTTRRHQPSVQGDIKCYHLHRSDEQAPMKLYVRLVGNARLVCRVGGGWSDLEEYLKEWATHHGSKMRAVSESRLEVQDIPTHKGPAGQRTIRPSPSNSSLSRYRSPTPTGAIYRSPSPAPSSRPVSPAMSAGTISRAQRSVSPAFSVATTATRVSLPAQTPPAYVRSESPGPLPRFRRSESPALGPSPIMRGGHNGTKASSNAQSRPGTAPSRPGTATSRPGTATSRPGTATSNAQPRPGPTASNTQPRAGPTTPVTGTFPHRQELTPPSPRTSPPSPRPDSSHSSSALRRVASRLSFTESAFDIKDASPSDYSSPDTPKPLGLAGPRSKKGISMTPENAAWVEGMIGQVRKASVERHARVLGNEERHARVLGSDGTRSAYGGPIYGGSLIPNADASANDDGQFNEESPIESVIPQHQNPGPSRNRGASVGEQVRRAIMPPDLINLKQEVVVGEGKLPRAASAGGGTRRVFLKKGGGAGMMSSQQK